MPRMIVKYVLVVFMGYLLYLGLLYVQQRGMMFPGTSLGGRVDHPLPEGARPVSLQASFGEVQGVFIEAPGEAGPSPAIVYFHGNFETVSQNVLLLGDIARTGLHVLLLEYPGYAGADGRPSRESLMETARAGHDWLLQNPAVDAGRIVAMGRSVGSGPAMELAAERELAGVVVMAGFTSIAAFARQFGAPGILVRDRFDNLARIREFQGPVLLFHGRKDTIIPFAHGQRLAEAASNATLVTMDCGHNDCPFFDDAFNRRVAAFVRDLPR